MYAHGAHTGGAAGSNKPCDGVRYNALHNSSLKLHEIDMLGIRKNSHGGERRCGGAFYSLFHAPKGREYPGNDESHQKRSHTERSTEKNTIDSHVDYSHEQTGQRTTNHDAVQYPSGQDMFSVEELLAHTSSARETYIPRTPSRGPDTGYSRIEKEMRKQIEKAVDVAYNLAEEVERKYGRKYDAGERKAYEGRSAKYRLGKKQEKGTDKAAGTASMLEKALKNRQKSAEKGERSIKNTKTGKLKKNDDRRALPSRPKAVRKGPAGNSRKGRKSRRRDNNTEQPESGKHKGKPSSGRGI